MDHITQLATQHQPIKEGVINVKNNEPKHDIVTEDLQSNEERFNP